MNNVSELVERIGPGEIVALMTKAKSAIADLETRAPIGSQLERKWLGDSMRAMNSALALHASARRAEPPVLSRVRDSGFAVDVAYLALSLSIERASKVLP